MSIRQQKGGQYSTSLIGTFRQCLAGGAKTALTGLEADKNLGARDVEVIRRNFVIAACSEQANETSSIV